MAPFQYDRYVSPYTNSIASLMERQGEIPALAAERVGNAQAAGILGAGQAWAGAAQNVGQAVSGAIQQAIDPRRKLETQALEANQLKIDAEKRAVALNGTVNKLVATAMTQQPDGTYTFDRGKLRSGFTASNVPIQLQEQTFKSLDEVDRSLQTFNALKVDHLADLAHATLTNPHGATPEAFAFTAALAKANGLVTDQQLSPIIDAIANGSDVKQLLTQVRGLSEKYKDAAKPIFAPRESPGYMLDGTFVPLTTPAKPEAGVVFKDAEGVEHPVTFDGKDYLYSGKVVTDKVTRPATKTNYQHVDKLLDGKPATLMLDPSSPDKIFSLDGKPVENAATRVKPIPPASTIINPTQLADVKETVAGMRDGTLPPILPGRATKEYTALLAEAHRQGYDLAGAATDWAATQKHIATMNGAQQLRMNQAINALPDMLDKVDALASQWKGGKFPILNKANLALAKGGAYGSDVASIANQLDAQIADVTADLGNVYMGGNSPTDHALGLAGKSLKGEWDEKVLHDMVRLAKANVTIRHNSIQNTGVAGASPNNPYAAPTSAPVEHWERGPDGNLRKVGG